MARRRTDGNGSALFPFLSILICTIGCLTMIIVVLMIIGMNKTEGMEPEEVERAREFVELEREQQEKLEKVEELKVLLEDIIQTRSQMLAQRKKLELLKEMLDNNEDMNVRREELLAKLALLQEGNKKLDEDHENLVKEIEVLKAEIERRQLPPDPSRMLVMPSGSGTNIEPHFVEIADAQILIHQSLTEDPIAIPTAALKTSGEFIELLGKIAEQPYRKLIFLVRGSEGSVNNLAEVNGVLTAYNGGNGTDIIAGKLPLPGEGKVDLSQFAQFFK